MPRQRLLFITPVIPDHAGNGLAMRTGFLLDAYAKRWAVDVALVPLLSTSDGGLDFVTARAHRVKCFSLKGPDKHFSLIAALKNPHERMKAFRQYGHPSLTARVTAELAARVHTWGSYTDYSAVHISRLYLAPLALPWNRRPGARPCLILDCDEDDAGVFASMACLDRRHGFHLDAEWNQIEADSFARLAAEWLPRFDLVFAASGAEVQSLASRSAGIRFVTLPNVAQPIAQPYRRSQRRPVRQVVFVGTMGYAPNADAVKWFTKHVWPHLRAAVPFSLRLAVVGRNPPADVVRLARHPDVVVTGQVRDVSHFYRTADLSIVPLRAGGGTRIKLLEAAAHRVPVVSTRYGARGTNFRIGCDILVADDATRFATACAKLLLNRRLAASLANSAYRRARREYDPLRWGHELRQGVESVATITIDR